MIDKGTIARHQRAVNVQRKGHNVYYSLAKEMKMTPKLRPGGGVIVSRFMDAGKGISDRWSTKVRYHRGAPSELIRGESHEKGLRGCMSSVCIITGMVTKVFKLWNNIIVFALRKNI